MVHHIKVGLHLLELRLAAGHRLRLLHGLRQRSGSHRRLGQRWHHLVLLCAGAGTRAGADGGLRLADHGRQLSGNLLYAGVQLGCGCRGYGEDVWLLFAVWKFYNFL